MFFVLFFMIILVFGGSTYYIARRVQSSVVCYLPKITFKITFSVLSVLTVMSFMSIIRPFGGFVQGAISLIGVCWMGVFVYLFVAFLVSDLVIFILRTFKVLPAVALKKISCRIGTTSFVIALIISAYGFYNVNNIKTTEYCVTISQSPTTEYTVALVSDIHLGAAGSEARLEKIVDEINSLEPDFVCIAGDFFDTDYKAVKNPQKAAKLLSEIKSVHGVYACLGNHDAGKTFSDMENFYQQAGIRLLKDEYVTIDNRLILAGRLDESPIGGVGGSNRTGLSSVLEGADKNLPIVVLDHNPASIDSYRGEMLVLSGHTHKGQISPGSLITNTLYTCDYGYYRSEYGTQLIVSSGAGIWGPPMRVGTKSEVVKIDLFI